MAVALLGDLNEHVEADAYAYLGIQGRFGYRVRNEKGC